MMFRALLLLIWLPLGESQRWTTKIRALQQQQQQQQHNHNSSCSFEDLFASVCSLEDYCASLTPIMASCSGDISSEWFILIQMEEVCFETELRESSFPRHSPNATVPLPDRGFCSLESAYFHFRGAILENAQRQEIITHPVKGLLQQVIWYQPCDDSVADSFFGRGYCADPCPQTVLQGSLMCHSQCKMCLDDESTPQILDCSNIHPALVETCGQEESFTRAFLQYLNNETSNDDSFWSDTSRRHEEPVLEGDESSSTTTSSSAEQSHVSWAIALSIIAFLLVDGIRIFENQQRF